MANATLTPLSTIASGNELYVYNSSSLVTAVSKGVTQPNTPDTSSFAYAFSDGQNTTWQMSTPSGISSASSITVWIFADNDAGGSLGESTAEVYINGAWQAAQNLPSTYYDWMSATWNGTWSTSMTDIRVRLTRIDPNGNQYYFTAYAMYAALTYTQGSATALSMTGPTTLTVGTASPNFSVSTNGALSTSVTVTPSDGGNGGTFSPTTLTLNSGTLTGTFTYTAASSGTKSISISNNGSLTNPSPISLSVVGARGNVSSGLQAWYLAGTLGLANNAAVTSWPNLAGTASSATQSNSGSQPAYETAGFNGTSPCVKYDGNDSLNFTSLNLAGKSWTIVAAVQWNSGSQGYFMGVGSVGGTDTSIHLGMRSSTAMTVALYGDDRDWTWTSPASAHVVTIRFDASTKTHEIWRNSTLVGTYVHNGIFSGNSNGVLGMAFTGNNMSGRIAEMLTFDRKLSNAEVVNVRSAVYDAYFGTTAATSYTATGPTSGLVGIASADFVASLVPDNASHAGLVVTPSDGGAGGTFTPSSVTLTTVQKAASFKYTSSSTGTKTISFTNNGGFANPSSISYASTTPSGTASVVATNNTRGGTWKGDIGSDGWVVISPNSSGGTLQSLPAYASYSALSYSTLTWADPASETKAMQKPAPSTQRIRASWYSNSFWTLNITVSGTVGKDVSIYFYDENSNRIQNWAVEETNTGTVYASGTLADGTDTDFTNGYWITFRVLGTVRFRFTSITGGAVVSGFVFDPIPGPATAVSIFGPTAGVQNTASSAFTVSADGTITGTVTVTPSDGGNGGTFSPTSVSISESAKTGTFTYTPSGSGLRSISHTNNGGLSNGATLTYLSCYKLSGTIIGTSGSLYNDPQYAKESAFDGNHATFFDSGTANGSWLGLDIGSPATIGYFRYSPRQSNENRMVNGQFEGSTSSTFASGNTTLATILDAPSYNTYTTASITPDMYRYVRYLSPNGSYGNIAEFEAYGYESPATAITLTGPTSGPVNAPSSEFTVGANGSLASTIIVTPNDGGAGGTFLPSTVSLPFVAPATVVPAMTTATTPSGVVSSSSEYNNSYANWMAFDNNSTTFWVSSSGAPQWLQYQFSSAKTIVAYSLVERNDAFWSNDSPRVWTLQGSNNGTSWTVLDSRSSVPVSQNGIRSFNVASPGSYTHYRLNVTSSLANVGLTALMLYESAISPTFTYTPSSAGTRNVGVTNNAALTNPSAIAYNSLLVANVTNYSFEIPTLSNNNYIYVPSGYSGQGWTFTGDSGVTSGSFGWTVPPYDGAQACFMQDRGTAAEVSQTITTIIGNVYTVIASFSRRDTGSTVECLWDGVRYGSTVLPSSNAWTDYSFGPFTATATSHVLKFRTTSLLNNDKMTYIDNVRVTFTGVAPPTGPAAINRCLFFLSFG